jgi:hypothetical protein
MKPGDLVVVKGPKIAIVKQVCKANVSVRLRMGVDPFRGVVRWSHTERQILASDVLRKATDREAQLGILGV